MKFVPLVVLFTFLLAGCSAYKELSPKPELSPLEKGYVELKNDKENFQLEKETRYFIKFPKAGQPNFMLVLRTDGKRGITSYLSRSAPGGNGPTLSIPDQTEALDTVLVYALDNSAANFYWMLDTVRWDMELSLHYRYVPQWRFTFENKYLGYRSTFSENTADRTTYHAITPATEFRNFNLSGEMVNLEVKTKNLSRVKNELQAMASLFPPDVAAGKDTAYLNYLTLKNDVDDELHFQEDYSTVLSIFDMERETHGNVAKFLEAAPSFTSFMKKKDRYPQGVTAKAKTVFLDRLSETVPFYESQLKSKADISKIKIQTPLIAAEHLYEACGTPAPPTLRPLRSFVDRFNLESDAVQTVNGKLKQLDRIVDKDARWGADTTYGVALAGIAALKESFPASQIRSFDRYANYLCAVTLDQELRKAGKHLDGYQTLYESGRLIEQNINAGAWAPAETGMRQLFEEQEFADLSSRDAQKHLMITFFEKDLLTKVRQASQQRADAFAARHELTTEGIPALYADSAFMPVHQLTFSAGGIKQVQRNRKEIQDYLDNLEYFRFPESSIRNLYAELTKTMNVRGVEKARAIVEHGKFYRGTDKQLRGIIDECDPAVAKWIIHPKEYRRILALPVSSNKQGANEYMVKVGLKIPSEAQFPVYDINIKLPRDVAEKAGKESWYETITLNKKPLKNEGRFRITSPTPDNNYESLITPVEMDKEGNNVLEIRFRFSGMQVFEVSAMAQVPIMRKN